MRCRPLRGVSPRELTPLLQEEARHWAGELHWDFSDVASAVANGLERSALTGRMLEERARPVAYCYYMIDGARAIVGSVFTTARLRGQGVEERLVDTVLAEALAEPRTRRVESQTLFSTSRGADERFSEAGFVGRSRHYMTRNLDGAVDVPGGAVKLRPLCRGDLGEAARVVYESHQGSLDAALNRTYATPANCRGFVETLVLRSGCGRFDPEASFVAEQRAAIVGVILASHLSRTNGHICQVSVCPESQGHGLGLSLVSAALEAFRRGGLKTASLSVTIGNHGAYSLYERLGFELHREFAAHAWARPPARVEMPA